MRFNSKKGTSVSSKDKEEDIVIDAKKEANKLLLELQKVSSREYWVLHLLYSLIFGIVMGVFGYFFPSPLMDTHTSTLRLAASVFFGICCFLILFVASLFERMRVRTNLQKKLIDIEIDKAQESLNKDIFANSVQMSYKYLDQYYLQTRQQAQNGFMVTLFVAGFGAILIFAGIVAMFLGLTDPAYVTCASGAVTELIAAVFFYLYNKTVSSMTNYHNKLVLSQNISIALRVADSLPEAEKTQAKSAIVTELIKNVNAYLIKSDSEADTPALPSTPNPSAATGGTDSGDGT